MDTFIKAARDFAAVGDAANPVTNPFAGRRQPGAQFPAFMTPVMQGSCIRGSPPAKRTEPCFP
jgi:hypothetical protein